MSGTRERDRERERERERERAERAVENPSETKLEKILQQKNPGRNSSEIREINEGAGDKVKRTPSCGRVSGS